ncbi:Spy/CpxP family protein refolding chaperone [Candidatus Endoriftia persephonae]|jgi:hypothetical protein|uniref:Zinc resistance-associated protein n=2 Tax=Gammaproteobacteria TaxID=1236 RepID=G2FG76_9GAMM|nr:Spy/CpxP family protein refolding chaperone [Candidatus Endoriftia persephone]EGW54149.1 hypothetical protein TevJSym_ap00160 [endosymbiont of Tevnia jerichonana (vent Tica)]USF88636.1 Spy/CpxP family protein refolding chaperone [Candidatus Endoriftia persephone]
MKQTTKQFLGVAAASVLVIGLVNGVFAHGGYGPGFGPGWGGHHGMMGGGPVAYADQQLIGLRSTLGITADQESAWNAYTEAVKGKAGLMASHRQSMFGSGSIAPEQRFTFRQQGLEQMQKVTTASRDLYSVLTPEQQARAGNLIGLHHALR